MPADTYSIRETLSCENLIWETPGGRRVLDGLSFALGSEKTALVGDNGSGKTTLARLLVGELEPTAGTIRRQGRIGWLPQGVEAVPHQTVASALGIDERLRAISRVGAGACDDALFEIIGEDWDIEARARAQLGRLGLHDLDLGGVTDRLSGGEAIRVALCGCFLAEPDLLVLDEPTNHLDTKARRILYDILDSFRKGLLVISHDRRLLRRMERTLELSSLGLRSYGGGWDFYREQVELEQQAARRRMEAATTELSQQRRAVQEARERQARRTSSGKKAAVRRGASRIEIQGAKRQAQRTAARLNQVHEDRSRQAQAELERAMEAVRDETVVRLDLSGSAVPNQKVVVHAEEVNVRFGDGPWLWPDPGIDLTLSGPARLALLGPSGCGKSTLARVLIGELEPSRGSVRLGERRLAWLDQRCRVLRSGLPLLRSMQAGNPSLTPREIYWSLDRFQLGRAAADRLPETLSGGERMRAALACLFGVGHPPRLLVLDEPTNHLDVSTVRVLEQALAAYAGAMIVISHDSDFISALGIDQSLRLGAGLSAGVGELRER